MPNIMDYLDWRGDLPLTVSPFNEVDNYLCSQMGMPDFSMIVPEGGQRVGLGDTLDRYAALWGERGDNLGVLSSPYVLPLLRRASETVRFRDVTLSHFVNLCDDEQGEQFSAVCVHLPDGSTYVSYRGTDDTLAGWREDFMMCVLDEVPAQKDALDYLLRVAGEIEGPLYLGGHSKGGNLAIYAGVLAPSEIQDRIVMIYNNDGPGFRNGVGDGEGLARIRERMVTILPQHSIVGTILFPVGESVIVNSSKGPPESHDGFYWQVLGTGFLRCEELSLSSRAWDAALDRTLEGMDSESCRDFVDALFDALQSTGARTLTELREQGIRQVLEVLRAGRKNPALQSFISRVAELTVKELAGGAVEDIMEKVPERRRPLFKKLGQRDEGEGEEETEEN